MRSLARRAIVLTLCCSAALAAPYKQREDDLVVREFRFQAGVAALPAVRFHYTTLGTPRRNAAGQVANAVLLLHGLTGTGKSFLAPELGGELFGPGQPLDAARWYVILPDGLGRGGSAKPSDGLHARFPRYGQHDVVTGQQLVVTQALGVESLRLVLGLGMGGMQAWLWAERFPEMMDAVMTVGALPVQVSGRNQLWRRLVADSIRSDPDWHDGDYTRAPGRWLLQAPLLAIMGSTAARLQALAPTRKEADALWEKQVEDARRFDANDFLYWIESTWDYDPEPDLAKIKARVLAVNFADDAQNPKELAVPERLVPRLRGARLVVVKASAKTSGNQTAEQAVVWKKYLGELVDALLGR